MNMSPGVAGDLQNFDEKTEVIAFPRWQVDIETMVDGALLSLLHPGFGWLSFAIAGDSLIGLRDALSQVIEDMRDNPRGRIN